MNEIAKILVISGAFLMFAGALLFIFGKIPGMGKMPLDIFVKKDNFSFYFPLGTCIVISIILSLVMFFLNKIR